MPHPCTNYNFYPSVWADQSRKLAMSVRIWYVVILWIISTWLFYHIHCFIVYFIATSGASEYVRQVRHLPDQCLQNHFFKKI